jgi:hypothetical protein
MGAFKDFLEAVADVATSPITREAINDVRQTVEEVYFDKPEHAMEPGTPMNPTQREVYEQKHEAQPQKDMDMDM